MAVTFRANLWKIYIFKFLTNLHFIGGVLAPFFLDWGGLSFTQMMFLQSWFMFWTFVLEIPTGTIADYFGRKHSLVLAAILNAGAAIIYGSVPSFYVFLFGEFLWAASTALLSGADEAFIYDTLRKTGMAKESKRIYTRIESIGLAGLMIGAPVGSFLAARYGLNAPMLLLAVPFSLAFLIGLLFKEPKTYLKIEQKRYFVMMGQGMRYFYKNKVLKILALDMIFIGSIAYFVIWLYQPILQNSGVDIVYFGIVHTALVGGQIVVMNAYKGLEEKIGSKRGLIFASSLLTGFMFIILGLSSRLFVVLPAIILAAAFGLSRRPLFISYMNKHIPSTKRATVLSTVSMLRRLALVIVNPLIGLLADWSLRYALIFLGGAAVIFSFISKVEENHLLD